MSKADSLPYIEAELNYLAPTSERPRYYAYEPDSSDRPAVMPIEPHTVLPLVHYLPPDVFRAALRKLGRDFFADEANLNLMSRRSLADAARSGGIDHFRIETVSLVGWPSNLLLIARKGT